MQVLARHRTERDRAFLAALLGLALMLAGVVLLAAPLHPSTNPLEPYLLFYPIGLGLSLLVVNGAVLGSRDPRLGP